MLVLSIQNSSSKNKVYFLKDESIKLPVSFIVGVSFICGSVLGGFLPLRTTLSKNKNL